MYNCLECGKEISGRINACPHCGRPYRYLNDVDVPYEIYDKNINLAWIWGENPTRKDFVDFMCNHYKMSKDDAKKVFRDYKKSVGWRKMEKKSSPLSIVALVLSIFVYTWPIGLIVAIIDLGLSGKDKTHNYDGSYVSLVLAALYIYISVKY